MFSNVQTNFYTLCHFLYLLTKMYDHFLDILICSFKNYINLSLCSKSWVRYSRGKWLIQSFIHSIYIPALAWAFGKNYLTIKWHQAAKEWYFIWSLHRIITGHILHHFKSSCLNSYCRYHCSHAPFSPLWSGILCPLAGLLLYSRMRYLKELPYR